MKQKLIAYIHNQYHFLLPDRHELHAESVRGEWRPVRWKHLTAQQSMYLIGLSKAYAYVLYLRIISAAGF
ncbi:MAG: hypothetical protein ABJN36_12815 [Cyclobacteriaceae bacterium]